MTLCERCGNYPNICGCAEADALEAQLAEAHASLAEGDKRYAAENARLAARLAEAERDAARYRWLQDCGGFDLPADDAIDAALGVTPKEPRK